MCAVMISGTPASIAAANGTSEAGEFGGKLVAGETEQKPLERLLRLCALGRQCPLSRVRADAIMPDSQT